MREKLLLWGKRCCTGQGYLLKKGTTKRFLGWRNLLQNKNDRSLLSRASVGRTPLSTPGEPQSVPPI